MTNGTPSKTGLMLLDDPEDTLKAMCFFSKTEFDKTKFIKKYEVIKGRKKPLHEKNADIHFYTLSIFKLFTKPNNSKNNYRLTPIAEELCELMMDGTNNEKFQQLLTKVLITNEHKGQLFLNFLNFTKKRKTEKEIFEEFRIIPAKTMIAWCKLAGLLLQEGDYLQSIMPNKKEVKLSQFKVTLQEYYNELEKTKTYGINRIFVPIDELRNNVCIKLNIRKDKFDELLTDLLSTDFGQKIHFHGATTTAYEKRAKEVFNYGNKKYLLVSMRD